MDQSLHVLSAMCSQGLSGPVLDHGRWNNDSGGEQFGGDIHDCDWHVHLPTYSQRVLAFAARGNPPEGPARGVRNYS